MCGCARLDVHLTDDELKALAAEDGKKDAHSSKDEMGELEDGVTLSAALLNVFLVVFIYIGLNSAGIYAFLQRGAGSAEAVARGRTILRGDAGIELADLNSRDTVLDYLSNQFMPGIMSMDTYQEACTFSEFYGPAYTYGRLSRLPSYTIRVVAEDPEERGCEVPFFSFTKDHYLGDLHFHASKNCLITPDDDPSSSLGGVIFGAAWGHQCEGTPNVPPVSISTCDYWMSDPPNAYLEPPVETSLCMDNQTFCEAIFISMQCTNRTECNIPYNTLASNWYNPPTSLAVQKMWRELSTITQVYWYLGSYWTSMFGAMGVNVVTSGMFPVDSGEFGLFNISKTVPGPPKQKYVQRNSPMHFVPRNETCYDIYRNRGPDFASDYSTFLTDELDSIVTGETPAIIANAYMPLATGKILNIMYLFEISKDGTYSTTEYVHVKNTSNESSRTTYVILPILAFIVIFLAGKLMLDTNMQWCQYIDKNWAITDLEDHGWRATLTRFVHKFHKVFTMLSHIAVLAVGCVLFTQFIEAYNVFDPDEEANKISALTAVCSMFYVSLVYEEFSEICLSGETLSEYFGNMWNWVDLLAVIPGLLAFSFLAIAASRAGEIDRFINKMAYPPYNAYREETAIQQCEDGATLATLISISLFALTFRLFKFLSIFPVLVVPFQALIKSKYEIGSFFITLLLFMTAFAFAFTFLYGGDIEAFSGIETSMETLFNAALDEFDDSVGDRLGTMSPLEEQTGTVLVFIFQALVTVSFMNMLITITMAWYEAEREKPESQEFLSDGMKHRVQALNERLDKLTHLMAKERQDKPDEDPGNEDESEEEASLESLRREMRERDKRLMQENSELRNMLASLGAKAGMPWAGASSTPKSGTARPDAFGITAAAAPRPSTSSDRSTFELLHPADREENLPALRAMTPKRMGEGTKSLKKAVDQVIVAKRALRPKPPKPSGHPKDAIAGYDLLTTYGLSSPRADPRESVSV